MSGQRLFRVMQRDHDLAWELVNQLTGRSGEEAHARTERHRIAQDLVALESTHEAAEELVVWPAVRTHCPEGDELVAEALLQEGQAKLVLNELRRMSADSDEFSQCANTVASQFRDHMSYEENQIWPRLEDHAGYEELERLAGEYLRARESGPTRPHPYTPSTPQVLRTAGLLLARLDRMRDRVLLRKVPQQ
jgi:hemerythrin superfamily protein